MKPGDAVNVQREMEPRPSSRSRRSSGTTSAAFPTDAVHGSRWGWQAHITLSMLAAAYLAATRCRDRPGGGKDIPGA